MNGLQVGVCLQTGVGIEGPQQGKPPKIPRVERSAECFAVALVTGNTPRSRVPAALHTPFATQHPQRHLPAPVTNLSPAHAARSLIAHLYTLEAALRERREVGRKRPAGEKPSPTCSAVHERVCPVGAGECQSPAPGVGTEGLWELGWPAWACPLGLSPWCSQGRATSFPALAPLCPTHQVSSRLCRLWLEPAWLGRCKLPSRLAADAVGDGRLHRLELPSLLTPTGPGWLCSETFLPDSREPWRTSETARVAQARSQWGRVSGLTHTRPSGLHFEDSLVLELNTWPIFSLR